MIDAMTRKPLRVSTDGTAGPYIMVPVSQLADLRGLLDKHRIPDAVEEDAISLDDTSEVAVKYRSRSRSARRFGAGPPQE